MNDRQDAGFTVIEVLVAFAILSLSLVMLYAAVSQGYTSFSQARLRQAAAALIDNKLAALGTAEPLQAGEAHGELGEQMTWRATVAQVVSGDAGRPLAQAWHVRIEVRDTTGQVVMEREEFKLDRR